MSTHFRYFVEGPCEAKLIKTFMYSFENYFQEGRVEVLNFINERLSKTYAKTIERDSKIAIVIDTDVENLDLLNANISTLERVSMINREDIYLVLSIKNFEEEIVYSCDGITNINQLFSTKGKNEFKNKFIERSNLGKKLLSVGFDINKIWIRNASNSFSKYKNDGVKIKTKSSNKNK